MNKALEQTLEFAKTFNQHIGSLDEIEPLKSRQLRVKLIFEELKEYAKASDVMETFEWLCFDSIKDHLENNELWNDGEESHQEVQLGINLPDGDNVNKTEQLDALTDLTVVVDGSKISGGFHEISDEAMDLVYQNNMNKAHKSTLHVAETSAKLGVELTPVYSDGKWLAYDLNGKLIKPHDHIKVKLSTLLELNK
jgi:hypothetical protein